MSVLAKILTQSTQQAQHLPHANQPRAKRPHEAYQKPIYEPLRLDPTAFYERFGMPLNIQVGKWHYAPFMMTSTPVYPSMARTGAIFATPATLRAI